MSLSTAQFLQWLRNQSSQVVVLAELKFGYESGGLPAEGTIYLADRDYRSRPTDTPASIAYRDVIATVPDFTRAIDQAKLGGRGTVSLGSLVLTNTDGSMDFLLEAILDGRDIAFFVGDMSWSRGDFRQICAGVVSTVKADSDSQLTIALQDKSLLLNVSIIGDTIASGPNLGKPKPITVGAVANMDLTPYLLDPTGPTYAYNTVASNGLGDVQFLRDSGVVLEKNSIIGDNTAITANAATDTITRVSHGMQLNDVVQFTNTVPFAGLVQNQQYWVIAAGLTANDFRVSATRGGAAVDITGTTFSGTMLIGVRRYYVDGPAASITLSASPAGRVTGDFVVGIPGSPYGFVAGNPHSGFRYLLDTYTKLTIADRDDAAFSALSFIESSTGPLATWGDAVLDRMNLMDLLDEIATLTNSWYGWNASGLLTVGKLSLPTLDTVTPIDTVTEGDVEGEPSCENVAIAFGRMIMDAVKNVVTQTDGLATSLTDTQRTTWAQKYQQRVKSTDPAGLNYLNDWWNYHKTAIDSQPLATAGGSMSTAQLQAVCDERDALFQPWTRIFRCTVGLDKYALNPGDPVLVTYPRYGLNRGKNFRVLSVTTKASDRAVQLVLVRQQIPDYATSSHV